MTAQNRVHRRVDSLKEHYNAEHDIGVDFNWVDMELLNLIDDLQKQVEELAARLWKLEHVHYKSDKDDGINPYGTLMQG